MSFPADPREAITSCHTSSLVALWIIVALFHFTSLSFTSLVFCQQIISVMCWVHYAFISLHQTEDMIWNVVVQQPICSFWSAHWQNLDPQDFIMYDKPKLFMLVKQTDSSLVAHQDNKIADMHKRNFVLNIKFCNLHKRYR